MQKPQPSTQWRLPQGAKVQFGKGGINEIMYFPDGTRLAVVSTIGHLDLRCANMQTT